MLKYLLPITASLILGVAQVSAAEPTSTQAPNAARIHKSSVKRWFSQLSESPVYRAMEQNHSWEENGGPKANLGAPPLFGAIAQQHNWEANQAANTAGSSLQATKTFEQMSHSQNWETGQYSGE